MTTLVYIRVSTDKQATEGDSLEAQREKAAAYATLYGLTVVEVIVDAGESAKTLDRPGLTRALEMLRDGAAGALLVCKLDRLTRSVRDLGELVETYFAPGKAALLSVAEQVDTRSASGRLVLNVLASVSQWEREAIGERTRDVLASKRARGERVSRHAPFGFRVADDNRLERDEREQAILVTARELAATGLSLAAVAAELAGRGMLSRAGTPFAKPQIHKMLRSEAA